MPLTLPPLDDILRSSVVVAIPFRVPFRGVTIREVMFLRGSMRVGEWSAFQEYSDEVSARWLAMALEQAHHPGLLEPDVSLAPISVNAIFPALPIQKIPGWWQEFPGARSAKIKVAESSSSLHTDMTRVNVVRETIGEEAALRLDANGRWSVEEAEDALQRLSVFSLDYVEQPVATIHEMVELKRRLEGSGIRLAADELIRESSNLEAVISEAAADVAVLKVSPLGGIQHTLELARQANAAGLEVVLSSALETSVGLSWGVQAAALIRHELGSLPDAGLATSALLEQDVVSNPIHVSEGTVPVSEPEIDEGLLEKLIAPPHRTRWWRERLRRCFPLALNILESCPG